MLTVLHESCGGSGSNSVYIRGKRKVCAGAILEAFAEQGFAKPTPIQSYSWPIISQGRDLIGIAETGSGKTLAYSIPALLHVSTHALKATDSAGTSSRASCPQVLILAPTRELALQIEHSVFPFCQALGVPQLSVYGGVPKQPQLRALRAGVKVMIATPGRLLDFTQSNNTVTLDFCDIAVIDEADRMLSLGFEQQLRAIMAQVRDPVRHGPNIHTHPKWAPQHSVPEQHQQRVIHD